MKISWFKNFHYYITQVIIGDAIVVFNDRIHKWSLLIKSIDNPFNIIFGYGERITPLILSECGCATLGDNIYFSNYGVGGIIKLLLYVSLATYVLVITYRHINNFKHKFIILFIQLSYLILGLFEDDSITGVTMSAIFSSIVFYSCNKIIKVDNTND